MRNFRASEEKKLNNTGKMLFYAIFLLILVANRAPISRSILLCSKLTLFNVCIFLDWEFIVKWVLQAETLYYFNMAILIIFFTFVLIVCAIQWIFRNRKLYEFADHIPGPKAYPVIGSSYKFFGKNEEGE